MKILLVRAQHYRQSALHTILSNHQFCVDRANTDKEAWEFLNSFLYDLVLLEASPPAFDGITLCRRLRDMGNPVLILLTLPASAVEDRCSAQTSQRIQALESGVDACLAQPIDERELLAQIQMLTRRGGAKNQPCAVLGIRAAGLGSLPGHLPSPGFAHQSKRVPATRAISEPSQTDVFANSHKRSLMVPG